MKSIAGKKALAELWRRAQNADKGYVDDAIDSGSKLSDADALTLTDGSNADALHTHSGGSMPELFTATASSQAEGDRTVSGPVVWDTDKCLIKEVAITTSSTNWDLWVLQNGNGLATDDAAIPARKIMEGGNGSERITVDIPYENEDGSNDFYLHFDDTVGTDTFDVYLTCTELA